MPRPELGELTKGDRVIIVEGRGRDGEKLCVVVGKGPKFVHVLPAGKVGDPWESNYRRKFLLRDMREGEAGTRVGVPASLATPAQRAWDLMASGARKFLSDLGIGIMPRGPLDSDDGVLKLARLLEAAGWGKDDAE